MPEPRKGPGSSLLRRQAARRQRAIDEPSHGEPASDGGEGPDTDGRDVGAAESSAATPARPAPRWRRVLGDLFRPSRAQLVLALTLCLVAMATMWQFRARNADETYSGLRRDELVALMEQLNTSSDDLRRQIAAEEAAKRDLESGATSRRRAAEQANKRIQELKILAGTAPAEGPGITLTIDDPQAKVTPELLLDGIEEMRDAGAEVMELNGVRVVASTWLGRGTDSIVVDGTAITAPFVLKVIGDPHALEEGARFRGGLVSRAQAPEVGAKVTIEAATKILITALHKPVDPRFAKPV